MSKTTHPAVPALKCTTRLNKQLKRLRPVTEEGAVHGFRVQYRKNRALYRMANAAYGSDKNRMPPGWVKFYRHTGRLRDITLLIKLVQEAFGPGPLLDYFSQQAYTLESGLQKEIRKLKPIRFCRKNWHRFEPAAIALYFERLLQPLDQSYHHTVTDQQLHEIRKNLKDLLYNIGWLKVLGMEIPAVARRFETADLEALLEQLGNYQNTVVQSMALRHLPPIAALHDVSGEINSFLHELAHRQSVLHLGVIRSLEHFFHLHTTGTLYQ